MGKYNISIASGHRESLLLVSDKTSIRLLNGESLSIHYVPEELRKARLSRLVALADLSLEDIRQAIVSLSLPGVSHEIHLDKAKGLLESVGFNSDNRVVLDDTVAGLISEIGSLDGICAFAGSGASVFVGRGFESLPSLVPRPHKVDGWGPLLGDYGSGFRLGLELLSYCLRKLDQNGHPPLIYEKLAKIEPDLTDPTNAQNWFDSLLEDQVATTLAAKSAVHEVDLERIETRRNWNITIASFAKVVTEYLEFFDEETLDGIATTEEEVERQAIYELLMKSANEMASSIRSAIQVLHPNDELLTNLRPLPIVCQGGMFRHSGHFYRLVQEALSTIPSLATSMRRAEWHPIIGCHATTMDLTDLQGSVRAVKDHPTITGLPELRFRYQ